MKILKGGPFGKITQCLGSSLKITTWTFMVSYAIVQASGKQFWVEEKRFYDFNKLPLNEGDTFQLNNVLLVNKNNNLSIGTR